MSGALAARLAALERNRVAQPTEHAPTPIDAASVRELLCRLLAARPEDRAVIVRAHRQAMGQAARSAPSTDSGARERVMRRLDALAERRRERQEHDAR